MAIGHVLIMLRDGGGVLPIAEIERFECGHRRFGRNWMFRDPQGTP
jgi:hypothetical protein